MRNSLLSSTAFGTFAAVLALGPATASATAYSTTPVTYSANNSANSGADWGTYDFSGIAGFNPAAGTLKSVLVVEKLQAHIKGYVGSASGTPSSAEVVGSDTLTILSGPKGMTGLPVLSITKPVTYYNTGTNQGSPIYALSSTPQLYDSGVTTANNGSGTYINNPGSTWESSDVMLSIHSNTQITATSSVPYLTLNSPSVTETFDLTISYNYTTGGSPSSVPEPASATLLGTGVLALGKLRKRKKRQAD